jgi:hypothetical protein
VRQHAFDHHDRKHQEAPLPAVLVLTYRDDGLGRDHPVHGLLGQASRSEQVRHLPLRRLPGRGSALARGQRPGQPRRAVRADVGESVLRQ